MVSSDRSAEYRAAERLDADGLAARLGERRRLIEEPPEWWERSFHDTFDWSLYLDGGVLERRGSGGGAELRWQGLEPGGEVLTQPAPDEPGWPAELLPGPVRGRILAPCGIRRLLPRMCLLTRTRPLSLLDDEDKTVVRLALDEHRFRCPETGLEGELRLRLRVLPVRGYDAECEEAQGLLADELGLVPIDEPLLLEALAAAGRRPAGYSSKIDYRLAPQARADRVAKSILLGLLDTLERNVAGARANLDSEYLHDLRVAVRRTRSALAQIREVFPESVVETWKGRFAWLQQVTGPVRDLDVYLLDFEDYRQSLPAPLRPDLEPLRVFILAHYDEAQAELARTLGAPELAAMLAEWRAFLDSPVPERPEAEDAQRPIKGLADARIRRMARRVRREGRAIGPESPPEELHELRKSCKKLRYLMEFFQSLYPESQVRDLVRLMKSILDNLGSFQDLSVQAEHLRGLAQQMSEAGRAETGTLLAIGALIGDLYGRRQRARDAFAEVFAGFLGEENRQRLKGLFESGPGPGSGAQDPDADADRAGAGDPGPAA